MEVGSYNVDAYPTFNNNIHLALSKIIEPLNNWNMFIYAQSRYGMGLHGSQFPVSPA